MPRFEIKGHVTLDFDYDATVEAEDKEEAGDMFRESIEWPDVSGDHYGIEDSEINIDNAEVEIKEVKELPEEEGVESDNPRT